MDNKTIFVRSSKGEDEIRGKSASLPGDVKRALLMVDGSATLGEISKRAAPSLRVSLDEMLQELEKGGFIQDKEKLAKVPKMAVPSKMVVPKIANPHKTQVVDEGAGELDFMTGYSAPTPETDSAMSSVSGEAQQAEKQRAEAEEKSRREIEARELEAAKLQAQREAEAILLKAEQDAARIREETARRAMAEAESTRLKAEQEAKKQREELAAAKLKAEQETRLRMEAEAKVRQQTEAAHIKAEQEAEQMRVELEEAKLRAEQEAEARLEAETRARARIAAEETAQAREASEQIVLKEREAALERKTAERANAGIQLSADKSDAARPYAPISEASPAAKIETFSFDAFQVDESQFADDSKKAVQQVQATPPAQDSISPESVPAPKPEVFSFDSFKIDEPQHPAGLHEAAQTQHIAEAQKIILPTQEPGFATQPAATQQPVKQTVTPLAASQPVDALAGQEQAKRATQERIESEKRVTVEAEQARKLEQSQAKVWAEAEQRAMEAAKTEAGRAVHQDALADAEHVTKPVPVERVKRKPFNWSQLLGFVFTVGLVLLVLLVGALFAVPYFYPMREYMPTAEKFLSDRLRQPVHVGHLSARILPTPRLELGEIYIGEAKQFQVEQAEIKFSFAGLFNDIRPVDSVELQGVKVSGAGLQSASAWLQQLAAIKQYPVRRMIIGKGTLDADAFQLAEVEGEVDFNPAGKFTQTILRANSGKYILGMNAGSDGKLQVNITVRDSALPLLPNWSFDELAAKGELSDNGLQLSEFDARIQGGALHGYAILDWRSGWRIQGTLSAKQIPMQNLNRLLEGNVDGSAHFKMYETNLAALTDSAVLEGNFEAKNGMINAMDIAETARTRSKQNLPGGRTSFDTLSGTISYADNTYHFTQTKIAASALNAVASFDVTKQDVSGKVNVGLSGQNGSGSVVLQLGGTTDSPTLNMAP